MNDEPDKHTRGHRERMRRRFLSDNLNIDDAQLLELLLTYAIPRRDVAPVAYKLLDKFTNIEGVFSASAEELLQTEGVGENAVVLFMLVQRLTAMEPEMMESIHNVQQMVLFNVSDEERATEQPVKTYANDEIGNALRFIPMAARFQNLEAYKSFLNDELPYNAASTRQRRASYLIERFYPEGRIDTNLTLFLTNCSSQDCLKPILFYHVLKTEPLVTKVAEEFVWPALPVGYIERESLRAFILRYLPNIGASTQKNILRSILTTYDLLGVGNLEKSTLRFGLHTGTVESFLYILTAEFPQPGTYSFQQLDQGIMHHWLLWHRDWMKQQLYQLRDIGVIAKISEIDTVRQFTLDVGSRDALTLYFSKVK